MYELNNGSFPDNRDIVKAMKDIPEVQKYMKKLMPFVQNYKVRVYGAAKCLGSSSSQGNLLHRRF